MACPNCCKVNFLAKWLEPEDRPYPYGKYEHKKPEDIPAKSSQHPDELEQQKQLNSILNSIETDKINGLRGGRNNSAGFFFKKGKKYDIIK